MRIAVINETSAADKNKDIISALEGRGYEIINAGMKKSGEKPELSYIHTGVMTGILLNLDRIDFVVGGCGTGQGYMEAAMQFPGVFCGYVRNALDGWLFTQINGGNCISLALNQGYGWAADVNLEFIFDRIFSVERGSGYPEYRKEPQKAYKLLLDDVSRRTHLSFASIIENLPEEVIKPVVEYPGMKELIDVDSIEDIELKQAFEKIIID
ncbi:MAG: RpiB/LacA/LacB family sugar-phosphate isomerase [Halanaerobiales bacterium]